MVWLNRFHGTPTFYPSAERELKFRFLPTSQIESFGADDAVARNMPSASPLINQFPNDVSDSECPFRYPDASESAGVHLVDCVPHSAFKLPSEYDPFKFLSAMTEQCLTGTFRPQERPVQSSAPATADGPATHPLYIHHPSQISRQNSMTSPRASSFSSSSLTSSLSSSASPPQFYTSQSASCFLYGEEEGRSQRRYSDNYSPSSSASVPASCAASVMADRADDYHYSHHDRQQQQQQQQQQQEVPGRVSETFPKETKLGCVSAKLTCKKNFFCSTEELMDTIDSESLLSWTRQHPEHWSRTEVLDWLFYVAQERGIDMQDFRGEAFQSLTGAELCRMTIDDFSVLEPNYGAFLYQMFRALLSGVLFCEPGGDVPEPAPQTACRAMSSRSAVSCDSARESPEPPTFNVFPTPQKPCQSFLPPDRYWEQEKSDWKTERSDSLQSDTLDIDAYDIAMAEPPNFAHQTAAATCPPEYEVFTPSYSNSTPVRTACFFPGYRYPPQLPRRRPGRPRIKSLPEDDERLKNKKVKNQHLWEFIYETLLNPLYNPQFLRWENQREGVFRFVQSEAVAQLWGSRKNNENMTYEKLSRAMRHYYKRGILERVEGRRLVYKFSRKAMDKVREKRHNSV